VFGIHSNPIKTLTPSLQKISLHVSEKEKKEKQTPSLACLLKKTTKKNNPRAE
jgi:hypothetical protein